MQVESELPEDTDIHLDLLGPSFPELQVLELNHLPLYNGAVFSGLKGCRHLRSIKLFSCTVFYVEVCAAKAATLHGVKEICISDTPSAILDDLSSTTIQVLTVHHGQQRNRSFGDIATIASNNQHLHMLEVDGKYRAPVLSNWHWQILLQQCSRLATLHLENADLQHNEVMTVVQYGLHIKSITVGSLQLHCEVQPLSPCKWEELSLCSIMYPHTLTLAYLPIPVLRFLTLSGAPQNEAATWMTLTLPGAHVHRHQLPVIVRKAATVIANTKSWKDLVKCNRLSGLRVRIPPDPYVMQPPLTEQNTVEVLSALAPLSCEPPARIQLLGFIGTHFYIGGQQLEALRVALGSGLTNVGLDGVHILPSFWAALNSRFPLLSTLRIGQYVSGAIGSTELALFCRAVVTPLTMELLDDICDEAEQQQLHEAVSTWGLCQVTFAKVSLCSIVE
jgi:hypothetical protein